MHANIIEATRRKRAAALIRDGGLQEMHSRHIWCELRELPKVGERDQERDLKGFTSTKLDTETPKTSEARGFGKM